MTPPSLGVGTFSIRELTTQLPPQLGLFFSSLPQKVKQELAEDLPRTSSLETAGVFLQRILTRERGELEKLRVVHVARVLRASPPPPKTQRARVLKVKKVRLTPGQEPVIPAPVPGFKPKPLDRNAGAKFAAYRKEVDAENAQKKAAAKAEAVQQKQAAPDREVFVQYLGSSGRICSAQVPMDKFRELEKLGLLQYQQEGTPRPDFYPK